VRRIDELFEIERTINRKTPAERVAVRQAQARPLINDLEVWMRQQRDRLAPSHDLAKAINYILSRWVAFTRFLDDGRICLSNNAAERAIRCVAVGRRNWTFAGSDAGGHRAAAAYTLIETALCRARHNAVYAAPRTMPSGFGMMRGCRGTFGRRVHVGSVSLGIVRLLTALPET